MHCHGFVHGASAQADQVCESDHEMTKTANCKQVPETYSLSRDEAN